MTAQALGLDEHVHDWIERVAEERNRCITCGASDPWYPWLGDASRTASASPTSIIRILTTDQTGPRP